MIDAGLACRIDRAEARFSRAVAATISGARVVELDGGASVFARVGSPINKIIGVGFDGPVDLVAAEAIWDEPVRIELSALASPEHAASLTDYHLIGFENVLVRTLATPPTRSQDHAIERGNTERWMAALVEGFAAGDGTGAQVDHYTRDAIADVMRDFANADGTQRYTCSIDGALAGAATLRIDGDIAILAGAATLPAMRRRGVQAALLAARLADAADAGCAYAVLTVAPGSLSQKNAMRSGFALGYTRAILLRGGLQRLT